MHNKISVIALMMDIPLTYLFNKQNDKGIEVGPVSYTHLDVYKRQRTHRLLSKPGVFKL